jgi:hypothetical protein
MFFQHANRDVETRFDAFSGGRNQDGQNIRPANDSCQEIGKKKKNSQVTSKVFFQFFSESRTFSGFFHKKKRQL